MLDCHQGFDASQMGLLCLLLRLRGSHDHVSLPKPPALLSCQFALCTLKVMRKKLPSLDLYY